MVGKKINNDIDAEEKRIDDIHRDNIKNEQLTEDLTKFNHFLSDKEESNFSIPNDLIEFIWDKIVKPINGSMPQEGAEGNMSGDGSGFLYYWAITYNYEGDDIIVGSGTNGNGRISNTSTFHPNEQELKQRIRKKIENRILGNEEY